MLRIWIIKLTARGDDEAGGAHGVESEEYGDELHGVIWCWGYVKVDAGER